MRLRNERWKDEPVGIGLLMMNTILHSVDLAAKYGFVLVIILKPGGGKCTFGKSTQQFVRNNLQRFLSFSIISRNLLLGSNLHPLTLLLFFPFLTMIGTRLTKLR